VPTARELGYKFDIEACLGLGLPKGAPEPILNKLRDAFKKSMDDPEFLDVMKKIYIPPAYRSEEEYRRLIEVTYQQYEGIIKELGLHKSQQKKKS
jgi:tripartite-type tricarboxylate transporter receptor subunit TctC